MDRKRIDEKPKVEIKDINEEKEKQVNSMKSTEPKPLVAASYQPHEKGGPCAYPLAKIFRVQATPDRTIGASVPASTPRRFEHESANSKAIPPLYTCLVDLNIRLQ